MAGEKNFILKNGLSVGTNDVLDSSGDLVAGAFGSAALEVIDDQVNTLLTAGTGVSLSYDDSAGTLTINGQQGDITGVNAGAGLTGTASSGDATLNIGAGTGITVNADDIAIDLKDEDDMSSNSASHAASQQSIKAYVDASILTKDNTDEITEGSSNLYFSNERVDDRVNALITAGSNITTSYDDAAGTLTINATEDNLSNNDTDDLTEGSSNLYFTDARARAALSATGDISYNSSTGVFSFTNDAGDIESVVAGSGLTGGATSGAATLNIGGGTGISVAADAISVNMGAFDSDDLGEGSTNLYHTSERVQDVVGGQLATNGSHTGLTATYDDAGDGAVDLAVSSEYIADTVGAMVSSNTESGITVAYQDADNTLDFTIGTLNQDTTGLAGTATALASARTISGVSFDGTANITLNTSGITESGNLYFTDERVDDRVNALIVGGTNITATYDDTAGTLTIDGNAADITGVTAGDGLSGGGSSGAVTLNLDASVAGNGLAHSSGVLSVTVDGSSITTSSDTLEVKALGITNAMLAGSIANAKLSNSTITVDGQSVALGGSVTTTNTQLSTEAVEDIVNGLVVGGTNITSTYDDGAGTLTLAGLSDANIRGLLSAGGDLSYNSSTGAISFTERTDAEVRGLHSAVTNGIGGLAYSSSTGAYTYTGPSATEVRAQLSAGTGVTYSGGEISIGQAVATSSNVTFGDLTLSGDLTVNGSTSTVSSTNTTIEDSLIELGTGTTGSPAGDAGIVIERGDESNVFMGWDDSASSFAFGTTTATGASTGALTVTPAAVSTGALTITNASNSGGTARNMYQSTSAPASGDGAVGDMWILYS